MGFCCMPFDQFTNRRSLEISIRSAQLARDKLLRLYDVTDDARDAARLRRRLKPELLGWYQREFGDESRSHFFPNTQHFFKRHFGPPILIFVSLYANERDLLTEFAPTSSLEHSTNPTDSLMFAVNNRGRFLTII